MAKGFINVDLKELEVLQKRLKALQDKKIEDFMVHFLKTLAAQTLGEIIFLTPRDTGFLVRGWTGGVEIPPMAHIEGLPVETGNKKYTIKVLNDVHYAPYVEYGHRTANHTGWVPGKFTMEKAIHTVSLFYPSTYKKMLEDFLKGELNV